MHRWALLKHALGIVFCDFCYRVVCLSILQISLLYRVCILLAQVLGSCELKMQVASGQEQGNPIIIHSKRDYIKKATLFS